MRKVWIGRNSAESEEGRRIGCEYDILVRESGEALLFESYGIRITLLETGEVAEVFDITADAARISALGELLCRNVVTPFGLQEVLADWL